ncbi:MAG: hypothetical protein HYS08_04785 [Chlamydiae bacterium]|nr:hypothetical protein [Chlamydiota bacterium]MBI3265796.1 hypothetical protein [Chlamydiota bacterium]
MKSKTSERFWKCYERLPLEIKRRAKEAYKQVHSTRPIFSIRITRAYRAVGVLQEKEITWFWIGSHSSYDLLLKR